MDITADTKLLLSAVISTGGRFGMGMPVDILRGSHNKNVQKRFESAKVMAMPSFGKGKHKTEKWWKALGYMLVDHVDPPLLEAVTFQTANGSGKTYKPTAAGRKMAKDEAATLVTPLSRELMVEESRQPKIKATTFGVGVSKGGLNGSKPSMSGESHVQ